MKKLILAAAILIATQAFAVDFNYDCKSSAAENVALPSSVYVQLEGQSLSIQNNKNDLYYSGKFTSQSSRVATGFKELILDGFVLISKELKDGKKKANLIIFDVALDSVETEYKCTRL